MRSCVYWCVCISMYMLDHVHGMQMLVWTVWPAPGLAKLQMHLVCCGSLTDRQTDADGA